MGILLSVSFSLIDSLSSDYVSGLISHASSCNPMDEIEVVEDFDNEVVQMENFSDEEDIAVLDEFIVQGEGWP